MKTTIAIAALAAVLTTGGAQAAESGHPTQASWVTRYTALEGFYHVVADKRFVGFYEPKNGACSINLLIGPADERKTNVQPMQLTFDVKPSQSMVMQAGDHQSLDIACNAAADGLAIHTMKGTDAGLAQTY